MACFMALKLKSHGASDVGLVRTNNEDVWLSSPEDGLFLVADGLGGHRAGEVAARESVDFFFSVFRDFKKNIPLSHEDEIFSFLQQCFYKTNEHLYNLACSHELLRGMGTTLSSLSFYEKKAVVAHVGDSRIYRLRDGELEQLTHDHCWTRKIFDPDAPDESFLYKGVLTRALGTTPSVEPTIRFLDVQSHDLFLLCSDGLSDMMNRREIRHVMKLPLTIGERVRMLVSVATVAPWCTTQASVGRRASRAPACSRTFLGAKGRRPCRAE